jgi:hypothetical protein
MKKEMTVAALLGVVVLIVPHVGYAAPMGPGVTATRDDAALVTRVKSNLNTGKVGKGTLHECW